MLVHGRGRQQIDLLPLSLDNSVAYLSRSLAFFVLLVGIIQLFQAGGALRSVRVLKAAVQAVVAHAVAIAVTRLLMENVRNLGRQFIGMGLVGILRIRSPKVGLGQEGRQLRSFGRRSGIVRGNSSLFG